MSQLQTEINLPTVESIDGFATEGSVTNIISSMENELNSFGNAIGNVHGIGDYEYSKSKLINSASETIGSEIYDPALPHGQEITSIVETHVLAGLKGCVLGLIADTGSITIQGYDDLNAPTVEYTVAVNPYDMSDTECFVDGRIILFKNPPYSFTIQYTGEYPTSTYIKQNGYRPNIIPNPDSDDFEKPTLSLNAGRVRISITKSNAIDTGSEYDDQYGIEFATYLLPFVDGTGTTPCPSAYISAYKLNIVNGKYEKIDTNNIYIINNTTFDLETSDVIDLINDTIIISIANTSIKEWVLIALRELQTHKHDGNDLSSPINHNDLVQLLPRSLSANIQYGPSEVPNNDHVQYIHREGYNASDVGSYGNAMLGDLFIASLDPTNLFNNSLDRSNKITFGETGDGHSVYRESLDDGGRLIFESVSNGQKIIYDFGTRGKEAIFIQTDDGKEHKIGNDSNLNLRIESASGVTHFSNYDYTEETFVPQDIAAKKASLSEVYFNPVSIKDNEDNLLISSSNPASHAIMSIPLRVSSNTIDGGILYADSNDVFARIYNCKEDGTIATALDNILVLSSNNDVYFTKNVNGTTTGISTDTRSNLYAAKGTFYSVQVDKSTDIAKNGIRFGQDHHIYVTPVGGVFDPGVTVIEAASRVAFAQPSLSIDVDNLSYVDVYAKDIYASGMVKGQIDATNIAVESIAVDTALTVATGATSTFNGPVTFNESIEFNDDVAVGVLTVKNMGIFENQLNTANASINDLVAQTSTTLKGQVKIDPHVSNPNLFSINIPSEFNSEVKIKDRVEISNELTVTSNSIINSAEIQAAVIENATISNASIVNLTIDTIGCNQIAADESIESRGTLRSYGETRLGFDGSSTIVHGDISMVNGNKFDASLCPIKNVEMPEYNYDFDSDTLSPIDPLYAKDAVNREYVIKLISEVASVKLLRLMYPIGTIYGNGINSLNPGLVTGPFGQFAFGEWEQYSEGRVLLGQGTYEEIAPRNGRDAITKTFIINQAENGEYEHLQSVAEMPEHSHQYYRLFNGTSGQKSQGYQHTAMYEDTTSPAGGYDTMNNMQPYTVAALWRRVG